MESRHLLEGAGRGVWEDGAAHVALRQDIVGGDANQRLRARRRRARHSMKRVFVVVMKLRTLSTVGRSAVSPSRNFENAKRSIFWRLFSVAVPLVTLPHYIDLRARQHDRVERET